MIVTSFAEVFSIGAVLPFLGALTAPEKFFTNDFAQPFITLFQIQSSEDLLLPFTLIFIVAALIAGFTRIILVSMHTHLSMNIGSDLSVKLYKGTLYQPYSVHVSRNSSEIIAGSQKGRDLVPYFIQPVLLICSSIVILIAVTVALFIIHPYTALSAFLFFGIIYTVVLLLMKGRVSINSRIIASRQAAVTKAIQEGIGCVRDVLICSSQPFFWNLYRDALQPMQRAIASNQVWSSAPKFGIEALGMLLIAGLAYVLTSSGGEGAGELNVVPILGAMALGAQRVLPLMQQIYYGLVTIRGHRRSNEDALDLLDQPMPEHAEAPPATPMAFNTGITLKDLGFRYTPHGPWVLRHLNLEIPKGSRVGFVGVTGSGKSTLLDLVMGLLSPAEGALVIDNTAITPQNTRAWQVHISHVPQAIFLSDTSIAENIAFGVPPDQIDLYRVKQAAQQAQIAQTIEGWRNGFDTLVGERGVRLSGGQRQRIGIARALYRRANVIIFDEATSALDNETEAAVMQAVETLGCDITILIIAHRLTTLRNCDRIVELANGGIKAIGGYEQMILRAA